MPENNEMVTIRDDGIVTVRVRKDAPKERDKWWWIYASVGSVLGVAFGVLFWVSMLLSIAKAHAKDEADRAAYIATLVAFIEDREIVDIDLPDQDECALHAVSVPITVVDSSGECETRSFDIRFTAEDSNDDKWHIGIDDDGYITVYEPIIYVSK